MCDQIFNYFRFFLIKGLCPSSSTMIFDQIVCHAWQDYRLVYVHQTAESSFVNYAVTVRLGRNKYFGFSIIIPIFLAFPISRGIFGVSYMKRVIMLELLKLSTDWHSPCLWKGNFVTINGCSRSLNSSCRTHKNVFFKNNPSPIRNCERHSNGKKIPGSALRSRNELNVLDEGRPLISICLNYKLHTFLACSFM